MKDYFQVKRLCGHWTRVPASHVGFPWYERSECDFCADTTVTGKMFGDDMVRSDHAYEMAQESAMLDSFWKR